jgi:uracil-DNA glycosylase
MTEQTPKFEFTSGPRNARIAIVGEAWGSDEAITKKPFIGLSGMELTRMLADAKIDREQCFLSNLVPARPDGNEMYRFFAPGKTGDFRSLSPLPHIRESILDLYAQLRHVRPDIIIACGNYPLWALTSEARIGRHPDQSDTLVPTGIGDFRGSMLYSNVDGLSTIPVLPIYHPSAILRSWELRTPTVHDLRTRVPMALSGDWKPKVAPNLVFSPTFEFALNMLETWIDKAHLADDPLPISCDIETRNRLITCVGFCDGNLALTIPLVRKVTSESGFDSHWTAPQEARITRAMCRLLTHPRIGLIGQNFLYDATYFYRTYGVYPSFWHDTMMAQHLLFPGTPKDLGYLSSLYCRYHRYWKDDNKEWDAKSDMSDHLRYNAEDCLRTYEIAFAQRGAIRQQDLDELFSTEMEKYRMAFEMSMRGIRIDRQAKGQLSIELSEAAHERISWLEKRIPKELVAEIMGKELKQLKSSWTSSPAQQKAVFYDLLGLPGQRHRKTGALTLDKEAIPKLKKRAPWASRIFDTLLELRSIEVFASTFVNASIDSDGRMRTSLNPAGAETFRWSSSTNPFGTGGNFQNLPKGKEM